MEEPSRNRPLTHARMRRRYRIKSAPPDGELADRAPADRVEGIFDESAVPRGEVRRRTDQRWVGMNVSPEYIYCILFFSPVGGGELGMLNTPDAEAPTSVHERASYWIPRWLASLSVHWVRKLLQASADGPSASFFSVYCSGCCLAY